MESFLFVIREEDDEGKYNTHSIYNEEAKALEVYSKLTLSEVLKVFHKTTIEELEKRMKECDKYQICKEKIEK